LYEMTAAGTLLFPAINVNDSVTKSKVPIPPLCASVASPGLPFVLNGTTDETHADNTSATTDIFVCHFVVCVCTIHSSTTCTAAATLCRTASCAART
jgi:hypothetical protein